MANDEPKDDRPVVLVCWGCAVIQEPLPPEGARALVVRQVLCVPCQVKYGPLRRPGDNDAIR